MTSSPGSPRHVEALAPAEQLRRDLRLVRELVRQPRRGQRLPVPGYLGQEAEEALNVEGVGSLRAGRRFKRA